MPVTADNSAVVQRLLDGYELETAADPVSPDIQYTISSLRTYAANLVSNRIQADGRNGQLGGSITPFQGSQEVTKPATKGREEIQIFSFCSTPRKSKEFGLILREESSHQQSRPSRKLWRRSVSFGTDQSRDLAPATAAGQLRVELIVPESYLERDGRLRIGDELLSINGQVLVNTDELKASKLLDNALKSGSVCLAVLRRVKRRAPLPPDKRNSIAAISDVTNQLSHLRGGPEKNPSSETIAQLDHFANSILHRRSHSLKVRGSDYAETDGASGSSATTKRRAPSLPWKGDSSPGDDMPIKRHHRTKTPHQKGQAVISRSDSVLSRTISEAKNKKREVVKLHLVKDKGTLGIQIAGGKDSSKGDVGIFVAGMDPASPAERDGRLQKGDEILMINGNNLLSVTHRDVAQLLTESGSIVQLVIARKRKKKKRTYNMGSGASSTSDSSSMSSQFSTPRGSPAVPAKQYHSHVHHDESLVRGGLSSGSASPLSVGSPMVLSRAAEQQRHRLEVPDSSLRSVSTSPLSPMKSKDKRLTITSKGGQLPPFRDTVEITLMKGGFGQGLGFNIIHGGDLGRPGIFIRSIFPGGPAATDGKLQEGDEILLVNGDSLQGLSQQQAINRIKQVKKGLVTLTIAGKMELPSSPTTPGSSLIPPPRRKRKKSQSEDDSTNYDDQTKIIREVTIVNERGTYFGISVVCLPIPDKAHESGVFVQDLAPKSPAEKTGKLCIGTQILEVNGQSLYNANSTNSVQYLFDNLSLGLVKLKITMFKSEQKSRNELFKAQELAQRLGRSPQEARTNLVPRRETLSSEVPGSRSMVEGVSPSQARDKEEVFGALTAEPLGSSPDSGGDASATSPTRRNKPGGNRQGGKRRALVVLSGETLPLDGAITSSSPPAVPPHRAPISKGQGNAERATDVKKDLKARHIYDEVALEPMEEGFQLNEKSSEDSGVVDQAGESKRIARIGSEMSRQFDDYVRKTVIEGAENESKKAEVPKDVLRRLRHLSLGKELHILRLERSPGERLGMGLNIQHTQEDNSLTEGVFIKSIHPGGAAARLNEWSEEGLFEGDEIVMANDLILKKEAYNKVIKHLSILPDEFTLVVVRGPTSAQTDTSDVCLLPKEEECLWDKIERHLGTKVPLSRRVDVEQTEEVELERLWQRLESELMNLTDSLETASTPSTNNTRPFSDEFRNRVDSYIDPVSSMGSLEEDVSVSDVSEGKWVQRCNGNQSDDDDDIALSSDSEGEEDFRKLEDLLNQESIAKTKLTLTHASPNDDTPCFTPETLSPKKERRKGEDDIYPEEMCEATPVTDIDDIISLSEEEEEFVTSTPAGETARRGIEVEKIEGQPFLDRLLESERGDSEPAIVPSTHGEVRAQANVDDTNSVAVNGSNKSQNGGIDSGMGTAVSGEPAILDKEADPQTSPVRRYKKNPGQGGAKGHDSSVFVSPLSSPEKGKLEFRLSSASGLSTISLSDLSVTDTDSDAFSMQSHDSPLRSMRKTDRPLGHAEDDVHGLNKKKKLIKADFVDFSFEDSSDEELIVEVDVTPEREVSGRSDVTLQPNDDSNITLGTNSEADAEDHVGVSSCDNQEKSIPSSDVRGKQNDEMPTSPRLPPDGHEAPRNVTCNQDGRRSPQQQGVFSKSKSVCREKPFQRGFYIDTTPPPMQPKKKIAASPLVISPEKPLFAPLFESRPPEILEDEVVPETEIVPVSEEPCLAEDVTRNNSTPPTSPSVSPNVTTQNKFFGELLASQSGGPKAKTKDVAQFPKEKVAKPVRTSSFFSSLTANSDEVSLSNINKSSSGEESSRRDSSVNGKTKNSDELVMEQKVISEKVGPPKGGEEFAKSSYLLQKLKSDLQTGKAGTEDAGESTEEPSPGDRGRPPPVTVNSQKLAIPKRLSSVLGKPPGRTTPKPDGGYEFSRSETSLVDNAMTPKTKFLEDRPFTGFEGYKRFSWERDLERRESKKERKPPVKKGSFKDNSEIKKRLAARLRRLPVNKLPDEEKLDVPSTETGGGQSSTDEKKPRLGKGKFAPSATPGHLGNDKVNKQDNFSSEEKDSISNHHGQTEKGKRGRISGGGFIGDESSPQESKIVKDAKERRNRLGSEQNLNPCGTASVEKVGQEAGPSGPDLLQSEQTVMNKELEDCFSEVEREIQALERNTTPVVHKARAEGKIVADKVTSNDRLTGTSAQGEKGGDSHGIKTAERERVQPQNHVNRMTSQEVNHECLETDNRGLQGGDTTDKNRTINRKSSNLPMDRATCAPLLVEQTGHGDTAGVVKEDSRGRDNFEDDVHPDGAPTLPTSPPPLLTSPVPKVTTSTMGRALADDGADPVLDELDEGVFEIAIDKRPTEPLGIHIEGGSDTSRHCVYIRQILRDSAAARYNRLRRGDQLLDVNGMCMVGVTHSDAMDVLLNHSSGPLHMVVSRQRRREDSSTSTECSGTEDLAAELAQARVVEDSDDGYSPDEEGETCFDGPSPMSPDSLSSGIPPVHFKPLSSTPEERNEDSLTDLQITAAAKRKMKEGVHPRYLQRSMSESSNSTVLLSTTELDKLIEDANQSLEENDDSNVCVIVLHKEEDAQGLGMTVAGGIDQEVREITVHKVIPGGLVHQDGRIQKGDRLLSINGKVLKDATHAELLKQLKTSRNDVVIVVARPQDLENEEEVKTLEVDLVKSSAGLGFSIAGGKSSPRGDLPITIKKIFAGGAADRSKELNLDDEISEVNGKKMANMTHFDAWTFLKSVPNGVVKLKIIPASR